MANGSIEMVAAEARDVVRVRAFRLRQIKHEMDPHFNNRPLPESEQIMNTASTKTWAHLIEGGIGSLAAASFMPTGSSREPWANRGAFVDAAKGRFAKEVKVTTHFNWSRAAARVTFAGAFASLAACATQGPTPPIRVEQKIENASSRLDHEEIAAQYDRQALVDAAAAKRHHGYAETYRKNVSPRSGVQAHLALATHCENLARTYQQASDENTAVAQLHRQLAAEPK